MPTICKYENCRTRPKIGSSYCSSHNDSQNDIIITDECRGTACIEKQLTKNFKGYCRNCYIRIFEDDPLSFQTRCKTKEIAINEYIYYYFDGFAHSTPLWIGTTRIDNRIRIENTTICIDVVKDQKITKLAEGNIDKFIFIRFNPNKYKVNGKSLNPMLYMRLPALEKEINFQINRVLQKENIEVVEIINLFFDSE